MLYVADRGVRVSVMLTLTPLERRQDRDSMSPRLTVLGPSPIYFYMVTQRGLEVQLE